VSEPEFEMSTQLINNGLAAYLFLAATCVALSGQFLSLRVVSLSLVASIAVGGYGAREVTAVLGTKNILVALLAGAFAGWIVGAIGARIDAWFKNKVPVLALLASLGFVKIVQAVITMSAGGSVEVLAVNVPTSLPDGVILATPDWLFAGFVAFVLCAAFQTWFLYGTRYGKSAVAIGDDVELAALFGVPINRVQITIQSTGGGIAGLMGVFMAIDTGLRPDLGFSVALKAFGVLIASRGRFELLFPWAAVLILLEQGTGYYFGGQLREAVGLAFLVVALLVLGVSRSNRVKIDPVRRNLGE